METCLALLSFSGSDPLLKCELLNRVCAWLALHIKAEEAWTSIGVAPASFLQLLRSYLFDWDKQVRMCALRSLRYVIELSGPNILHLVDEMSIVSFVCVRFEAPRGASERYAAYRVMVLLALLACQKSVRHSRAATRTVVRLLSALYAEFTVESSVHSAANKENAPDHHGGSRMFRSNAGALEASLAAREEDITRGIRNSICELVLRIYHIFPEVSMCMGFGEALLACIRHSVGVRNHTFLNSVYTCCVAFPRDHSRIIAPLAYGYVCESYALWKALTLPGKGARHVDIAACARICETVSVVAQVLLSLRDVESHVVAHVKQILIEFGLESQAISQAKERDRVVSISGVPDAVNVIENEIDVDASDFIERRTISLVRFMSSPELKTTILAKKGRSGPVYDLLSILHNRPADVHRRVASSCGWAAASSPKEVSNAAAATPTSEFLRGSNPSSDSLGSSDTPDSKSSSDISTHQSVSGGLKERQQLLSFATEYSKEHHNTCQAMMQLCSSIKLQKLRVDMMRKRSEEPLLFQSVLLWFAIGCFTFGPCGTRYSPNMRRANHSAFLNTFVFPDALELLDHLVKCVYEPQLDKQI